MNNTETLKAQIAAKVAAYQAANRKPARATFGLPVANVGHTFATKQQAREIERQKETDFSNVHHSW